MKIQPNLIPRFKQDYTVGDAFHGIKSLLSHDDSDFNLLVRLFGKKKFYFTNRGRSSLYIILKSLGLPRGSKIGVPLYSCTVVFDAIIAAGFTPYFIDTDLDNYTVSLADLKVKISDISAVIIIHTFGRPAEMDSIRKIAKDIPIIEDCAHSFLSEYKGEMTGNLGEASFFSLEKYVLAGGGGLIVLNNNKYSNSHNKNINDLKKSSLLEELKHLILSPIFTFLYNRPWYGIFSLPIGSYVEKKIDLTSKKGFKAAKKIRKSDQAVFLNKLVIFKDIVDLQRKNSQIMLDELKEVSNFTLSFEKKGTFWNHYLFPIRYHNRKERDFAHSKLMSLGVDSAKLFSETPEKARLSYGYKGDCKKTEVLADTILIIPNYYSLSSEQILKVTNSIKDIAESR